VIGLLHAGRQEQEDPVMRRSGWLRRHPGHRLLPLADPAVGVVEAVPGEEDLGAGEALEDAVSQRGAFVDAALVAPDLDASPRESLKERLDLRGTLRAIREERRWRAHVGRSTGTARRGSLPQARTRSAP
jgi:hypothetical protein